MVATGAPHAPTWLRVQEPWHEPPSVEAIAGDELGRGASSGAPVRTTMGGGGAELTQPHQLWKAATARRVGSQRNRSAAANGGVHALAISEPYNEGERWWKSEMRRQGMREIIK